MAAEFFISFKDPSWYAIHRHDLESHVQCLSTFAGQHGEEFWLRGIEMDTVEKRWGYDVRLFFMDEARILMEISTHPKSVEKDISSFLAFIRKETEATVVDEDGDSSGW